MAVTFEEARACVIKKVRERAVSPPVEEVSLLDAPGRVLAERITADRDFPALPRSVRDGFAVQASDVPGKLWIIGEVRAGDVFSGRVEPGQAVEIMTGAPMPDGADAVVMVEHTTVDGDVLETARQLQPGENVNPQASEAAAGEVLLAPGIRFGFAQVALAATVGRDWLQCFRRPRVAIIATGDEILDIGEKPKPHQLRNSNSYSLAVQVARAGGIPEILPVARDEYQSTRGLVEQGLTSDLLLLSGGVSAGKYDLVEKVLGDLGAEFYFDRVLIQPGQPLVFGSVGGKFFFGLPGNPGSTMVTFELFARAALELLSGETDPILPLTWSRLSRDFKQKTGLTRFLPAQLSGDGSQITPVPWHGSGDVPALAASNCFLVTEPDRESWAAGDLIRVLMK